MKNKINDMTRNYDGFIILNIATKEEKLYPYRKGINSIDAERQAFAEQMLIQDCDRASLIISGFVPKGRWGVIK